MSSSKNMFELQANIQQTYVYLQKDIFYPEYTKLTRVKQQYVAED